MTGQVRGVKQRVTARGNKGFAKGIDGVAYGPLAVVNNADVEPGQPAGYQVMHMATGYALVRRHKRADAVAIARAIASDATLCALFVTSDALEIQRAAHAGEMGQVFALFNSHRSPGDAVYGGTSRC